MAQRRLFQSDRSGRFSDLFHRRQVRGKSVFFAAAEAGFSNLIL